MGSGASKASKAAVDVAKRQYPTRVPPTTTAAPKPPSVLRPGAAATGPSVHPKPHASSTRDETVRSDAFDPQLAESLRRIGPVQTAPTLSHSSIAQPTKVERSHPEPNATSAPVFPSPSTNPALMVLEARRKLSERAEQEFEQLGRKGFLGKELVDVATLKRALDMRSEGGLADTEIEKHLNLRPGIMRKLGPKGVVAGATADL